MRRLSLAVVLLLCGIVYATAVIGNRVGGGNFANSVVTCEKNDDCLWGNCCNNQGFCVSYGRYWWNCKQSATIGVNGGESNAKFANATNHFYKAEQNRWDMKAANVYCSTWNSDKLLTWRQKYGWAGFCAPHGLEDHEACGKCLKVINPTTGVYEIVRIVDKCNNRGLVLDNLVFKKLDTTGNGRIGGQLTLKYDFVDCED